MTPRERQQLEALARAGHSVADMAAQLGFCRQTIYNELKVGAVQVVREINGYDRDVIEYSAEVANQKHAWVQSNKGAPLKIGSHHNYAQRLEDLIRGVQADGTVDRRRRYSPYAAPEITKREGYPVTVCKATLYSYIEKGIFRHLTTADLWEKSKRRKRAYRPVQRIAHPKLPSIEERPPEIAQRTEEGHWEMDLVVGKAQGRGALLTLTEQVTRMEAIFKLPDKKADSVIKALRRWEPAKRGEVKSITTDNGSEFLRYGDLRRTLKGAEIYYCHSYAAWEKGTNERHNRLIRRWYPKGTKFDQVTQRQLDDLAGFLNHYPRRELGGLTPVEKCNQRHEPNIFR